jgi:hypothetical protein
MAGLGDRHHVSHATIALAALVLAGFLAVTLMAASLVTRPPPPERFSATTRVTRSTCARLNPG